MTAKPDGLLVALIVCTVATFVHHVHNAEFLDEYPNLPGWLSAPWVYVAWLGATAVGVGGYLLTRGKAQRAGAIALLAYAAYAVDGLLHYTRAPLSDHTPAMNGTILFEALAGLLLAGAVVRRMVVR
jgi:hypothetical protein